MPPAPASMLRTKRSCPGTSTNEMRDPFPLRVRETEVDRDAAFLLLGEPVGVDARQGFDQSGLAVVDVARGPEQEALQEPHRNSAGPRDPDCARPRAVREPGDSLFSCSRGSRRT